MTYGDNTLFPFNNCNTDEINKINNTDRYIPLDNPISNLPKHIITEQAVRVSGLNTQDKECEINLTNLTGCKYYSSNKFLKITAKEKTQNKLNIFHNIFNGLESKFDQLHHFLTSTDSDIDIIAITETSQQQNDNVTFKTNVKLEGYELYSTPTNTNKGGVAVYAKNKFNVFERSDLNITNDHYESIWIEIKNNNSKNIIIASIYRHPHDTLALYDSFLDYLELTLVKLNKENKELYLCGNFNSDILKIDTHNNYKRFYVLLSSYGLVPLILLPTRIDGDSATIVDNIFSNNLSSTIIISGNIVTDFSDHFSQFISIQRPKLDYKSINIYKRDYSNFSEKSFRDYVYIYSKFR